MSESNKASASAPSPALSQGKIDVEAYLSHYNIIFGKQEKDDGTHFELIPGCLFDTEHSDATIIQPPDGTVSYCCSHDSCRDKTWDDARRVISGGEGLLRFTIYPSAPDETKVRNQNHKKIDWEEGFEMNAIEIEDFLEQEMPDAGFILSPWLRHDTLGMIHARRGVGKSLLVDLIALSVTRGVDIGPWKPDKPGGVLIIDGEMSPRLLQKRLKQLSIGLPKPQAPLHILSSIQLQKKGIPMLNINNEECREALYSLIKKHRSQVQVVILDNIRSLASGIDEISNRDWDPINEWLLRLRALGVAVIVVHHSGKGGDQRGTSGREDNLDVSLKLTYMGKGREAFFKVEFTKSREAHGEEIDPFAVRIVKGEGGLSWTTEGVVPTGQSKAPAILAMLDKGYMQKDIAKAVGCHPSYITTKKRGAIKAGLLTQDRKFTDKGREIYGGTDIEEYTDRLLG